MAKSELLLLSSSKQTDPEHVSNLRRHGFGVHPCSNAAQAAKALDTRPIAAILIHSTTPPREMETFLEHRVARHRLVPVFFVSLTNYPNLKRLLDHPRVLILPAQPDPPEVERLLVSLGSYCRPPWQQDPNSIPTDLTLKIDADEYPIQFKDARAQFEKQFLECAFRTFHGNLSRTARAVQMARRNLQVKVQKHNIDLDEIRREYGTF